MEGREITELKSLSKIKSVEEMLPKPARENQTNKPTPKIGENEYKIIEDALRLDCTIEDACMYAWISVQSYYKHREKNPDFAIRMDRAREFPKVMARAAVMRRIAQWDSKTAIDFLKLRDKRYRENGGEEPNENVKTKVEFTLVPSIGWAENITNNDTQTNTSQSSAYDLYATSWEKKTPWENEEQALRNIDLLTSNSD